MKHASVQKKKIIKITANILKKTNGLPFSLFYAGLGQVLMFHRVVPDIGKERIWSNKFLEVSPEFLENIILYYKKLNYNFIAIGDIPEYIQNKKKKFVVFTFDDGYKDNLTYALPVFEQYNIPFVLYIATDFPDNKINLWWYKLEQLLLNNDYFEFEFKEKLYSYKLDNMQLKNNAFEQIHYLIKTTSNRQNLFNVLFESIEKKFNNLDYLLSWEDIIFLSEHTLVTIGAHSIKHISLSKLHNKEIENELIGSKTIIENRIKKTVHHFAYPFGSNNDFGEREINILRKYHFITAVTTISHNVFKKTDLLTIPRIACGSSMTNETFDLIRFGVVPMLRNKGRLA